MTFNTDKNTITSLLKVSTYILTSIKLRTVFVPATEYDPSDGYNYKLQKVFVSATEYDSSAGYNHCQTTDSFRICIRTWFSLCMQVESSVRTWAGTAREFESLQPSWPKFSWLSGK